MERFWSKVAKTKDCWEWTAARAGGGYGRFYLDGHLVQAHRFAYEVERGPVPDGLVLDHLCRNTACVRPDHLEAVEHGENLRRGTKLKHLKVCKSGRHDMAGRNLMPGRRCRACHNEYQRNYVRKVA